MNNICNLACICHKAVFTNNINNDNIKLESEKNCFKTVVLGGKYEI